MGLDYLNKKSWHTGSIQNIEKVWIREQKEREKLKLIEERKKKLLEERHQENMKKLQIEAGYIPANSLHRMDWMQAPQQKQLQQQTAEQYLEGKEIDDDFKPSIEPVEQEEFTNDKCEDFAKLRDDPLYYIRMEEEKRKNDIKNNPLEIQKLLKQLEEKKAEQKRIKKEKKQAKKEKKQKKKDKKNKKHKKKNSSRSRSRSNSQENKKKKKKKSKKRSHSSSSSSSSSSDNDTLSLKSTKSSNSQLSAISAQSSASREYFQKYMEKKLGGVVTKDENGNLITDFGRMKRMFKPQKEQRGVDTRPMTEEEKDEIRKQMIENAKKVNKQKEEQYQKDYENDKEEDDMTREKNKDDFMRKMQNQIYNKGSKYENLEDRMGRNKHRFQRNLEKDSNSYA